jgi:pimeloyl-ACP methyl ester carboxylesterase
MDQLRAVESAGVKLEEGDAAWRETKLAELGQLALILRVPEDRADEFAARSLLALGPQRWRLHPSPTMFEGLWGDQRLFDLYRSLEVPVMVLLAPRLPPAIPDEFAPLLSAYRRGLARAFATLDAEQANVEVVTLEEAHHNSIVGRHAEVTAAAVKAFLGAAGYPPE